MKTRIIENTYGDGTKIYIPQYKSWGMWWNFNKTVFPGVEITRTFDTREEAESFIRDQIKLEQNNKLVKRTIL